MINKVILIGNVGKDPEIRHLDNNLVVARFSLATSESYKNKSGERITNTEWHNLVLWRGLAEIAEKYVKKGSQIYVEGKIRYRSWDDKDGNKRYTTEIDCETMQLMSRKQDDGTHNENQVSRESGVPSEPMDAMSDLSPTDDLPF